MHPSITPIGTAIASHTTPTSKEILDPYIIFERIAIVLLAAIREKVALSDVPKAFVGFPIAMVSTGLMAIAFLGFAGLI